MGAGKKKLGKVCYADLWGTRKDKYEHLMKTDIATTDWQQVNVQKFEDRFRKTRWARKYRTGFYFLTPKSLRDIVDYGSFYGVDEIFREWSSGVETGRDEALVGFNTQEKVKVYLDVLNPKLSAEDLERHHGLRPSTGWRTHQRRSELFARGETFDRRNIVQYDYRPFDTRFTYYSDFLRRAHRKTMRHLLKENLVLVTSRLLADAPFRQALVTQHIGDRCYVSIKTKETGYFFPLYLYTDEPAVGAIHELPLQEPGTQSASEQIESINAGESSRVSNFTPEFLQVMKTALGVNTTSEEMFYYLYAVLYSPTYRKRYEEFLTIDFPRIPLPSNRVLFGKLSDLGRTLVELHLLKHPGLGETVVGFPKGNSNIVNRVVYDKANGRVFINEHQYFEGVSAEVWEYRIGAYQVMEKYLKDRKKRKLSLDEINHYLKVAKAIGSTIDLQKRIDDVYARDKSSPGS